MKKIYVKDILRECNGILLCGNELMECNNFSKDTRNIKRGDVFIAIKGDTFDGNKFYEDALDKGASVCLVDNIDTDNIDKEKYKDKCIILVTDTVKALGKIAKYKRSLYNIPVIGVTGSVGKTSTKDMIASVIETKYKVLKTEGNNNNHIGLPLTILRLKDEEVLIVEMGMNHLGEISYLTDIAKPTVAVITNVGTAHIGILGSRENILKAKLEILEGLLPGGLVVINNDNDMLNSVYNKLKKQYNVKGISIDNESDYKATIIEESITGSKYKLSIDNKDIDITVNVPTRAFVYNSIAGFAIGKHLSIEEDKICNGIIDLKLTNHRLEKKVNSRGVTIIDDSYNASYDSVKTSVELLGKSDNRKIVILGDMLELGEYSEEIHKKVGQVVANNNIDLLITVGSLSKFIKEEALKNNFNKENVYSFDEQSETYELLNKLLKKDDIVLVKGSNGIHLTEVVNKIMEFN